LVWTFQLLEKPALLTKKSSYTYQYSPSATDTSTHLIEVLAGLVVKVHDTSLGSNITLDRNDFTTHACFFGSGI
jgi:hypothetical protein